MSVNRGNSNFAASVSHTEKQRKKKWLYLNAKSCMAMAVSAALLFTSVDGIAVRAEELSDMVLPVTEEEKPAASEKPETSEESLYLKNAEGAVIISSFEALQEKESRIELEERKTLEEVRELMPKTLTANLTRAVSPGEDNGQSGEGGTPPGEGEQPDGGETPPGEGEQPDGGETPPGEGEQPDGGETTPGEGEQPSGGETTPGAGDQPDGGETTPGEEDQPSDGEAAPGEGDQPDGGEAAPGAGEQPGGGETTPGEGEQPDGSETTPGEEDQPSGGETSPDEGEQPGAGGDDDNGGINDGNSDQVVPNSASSTDTADASGMREESYNGSQWRLLVETGEAGADYTGSETDSDENDAGNHNDSEESVDAGDNEGGVEGEGGTSAGDNEGGVEGEGGTSAGDNEDGVEGEGPEGIGDGTGGTENGSTEDNAGNTENGENSDTTLPPVNDVPSTLQEEVPVTWECENYETDEADSYTFVPKWDEKEWFFEESKEHKIPTIEVVYVPTSEVTTEEELTAAFAAGFHRIVLQNDIALTKSLVLPADADMELDGGGYKLTRGIEAVEGEEESSSVFLGVMIDMDGEDYTEDTYGTLTLKNITVEGSTEADRAGAPVILNRGNLILDEGAVIKDNFNYGVYPGEGAEEAETILDYGGGIQVYGELTVSPDALVTENFADEFGGGVYLADGATLYLYADVIVDNNVGEGHGYGADLYAAPGSTIYYDPSIDMEREGFYICEGVNLKTMDGAAPVSVEDAEDIELFVSVNENSGYSREQIKALKQALRDKGFKVLEGKSEIITTDLRNWYVYDHYDIDSGCGWGGGTVGNPPQAWVDEYGSNNDKRKYYPYSETKNIYKGSDQVYTIKDWLEEVEKLRSGKYTPYGSIYESTGEDGQIIKTMALYLAKFREHIYSREQAGRPMMTFVGYGITPNVDFLYYDPQSDGEKVVNYNVDSSQLDLHTLNGNGFLVNTGVEDGKLYGYLVFYTYTNEGAGIVANSVSLYQLKGVPVDLFHDGAGIYTYINTSQAPKVTPTKGTEAITDWDNLMSVRITATPDQIEIRQQPQSSEGDISESEFVLTYDLTNEEGGKKYSGFGPLVAYGEHSCESATTFTYSDIYMYYTNPMLEQDDILSPLEMADFTQKNTQKYFVNLLGDAKDEEGNSIVYNQSASFGQYQEYMKMMQHEGIALVTDRETPFQDYLGKANDGPGTNLFELAFADNKLPSPEELAEQIANSIFSDPQKTYTDLTDKIKPAGHLSPAEPTQSVGNIWLESAADGGQIRGVLKGTSFGENGYEIQIRDDLTDYYGDKDSITVTYEVFKPGASDSIVIGTTSPGNPLMFTITADSKSWPSGRYTVMQTINNSKIHGYSYFELKQPESSIDPSVDPVTVQVKVRKNGKPWYIHGKIFMLQPQDGGALISPSESVPEGTYVVYDVTGLEEGAVPTEDRNTGVQVIVSGAESPDPVRVDYYTVTFHNGDTIYPDGTPQAQKTVLRGKNISQPDSPSGEHAMFAGWVTEDKGSNTYDFSVPISEETDIYASWTYPVAVNVKMQLNGNAWEDQMRHFMLLPEGSTDLIELSQAVYAGTYHIYDVTDLEEGAFPIEDMNTGFSVEVKEEETEISGNVKEVTLNYYTVTFYDGLPSPDKKPESYGNDTDWKEQIVLEGRRAVCPVPKPEKEKYSFLGWVTEDEKGFNFNDGISGTTRIYAMWEKIEEPRYKVTVNARKDGNGWEDAGRMFALLPEGEEQFISNLEEVKKGIYHIYDITGAASASYMSRAGGADANVKVDDGNTGVTITVENKDETASVDYYTVTFYDGGTAYGPDTPQCPIVVLNGKTAVEPPAPEKTGYQFIGWKTEEGGSTAFHFEQIIESKTDIYADWQAEEVKPGGSKGKKPERENPPDDGGGTGDTQTVTVVQEASSQAEISRTDSVETTPWGTEPKTGDAAQIEIYATAAMIAGLTYLLLYFMEEGRGMTEREKEVFVAAFIRWAKKGGRFRRCCAIVAIFCILVYYHSIGKHAGKEINREYLRQAL